MSKIRRLRLLILALLALVFAACKYDLVKETTFDYNEKKNAADYDDFILPPESVTASQGQSKSVVLSWLPVKNAVQYYIYSAPSPYDSFVKISETRGAETEIVIDEEPGITKYYCVSAVNYYGSVSAKSIVVMGTSLAVPVITEIEASEEGDAVSVEWWMDNCSDTTYEDSVEFYIYTSLKSSPNIKYKTEKTLGSSRRIRIDGLVSKTEYLFEVEVVNNQTGQKETSGKYSAETAHRVLPDPPLDFTVTQGTSTSEILLSWKTPDGAWYRENSGASGFVKHPVYFEVYRKEAGKADYTRIKTIKYTDTETDFTWVAGTECPCLDDPYSDYSIGAQITFADTISEEDRGKKYSYYVQSVTDDTPDGKKITSQSSCTLGTEGWTVAVPAFTVKSNYEKDGDCFTKISFTYNLKFENYGVPYSYFVTREQLSFGGTPIETEWVVFNSVESLNSKVDEFLPAADSPQNGYYKYTLYVCPLGTVQSGIGEPDSNFYSIKASGKYIVTHDATKIPEIRDFTVEDGYADRFELSWTYNSGYVYTIHWWEMHGSEKGSEETLEIVPGNGWENDQKVTYSHNAESGSRRNYQLEASTGISAVKNPLVDGQESEDYIFETLGTAEPVFTTYDYNTITVTWPKVQKADEVYTVSAKYEGSDTELVTDDNKNIQFMDDDNTYQCVITNPVGWDDATKSGKKINLTVTAKNGTKGSTTSQAIPVCTLGPALADLKVAQTISEKEIILQWNKIEGAAGYKIIRQRFSDGAGTLADPNGQDIYYVKGETISINREAVDSNHALVRDNQNGTFLFTDKSVDQIDTTNSYTVNQACIEWGLPFSYQILPIKEGSEENNTDYANPQKKLGATKGYGLKVQAEKSKSADKQVVRWEKTFNYNKNNPVLYYRAAGSTMNKWTKLSVEFENDSQTKPFAPPEQTAAYEYLIVYGRSASELTSVPLSLLEDSSMGGLSTEENGSEYDYTNRLKEKANKGYLLAVNYTARTGSGYSEIVSWDEWDYSKRSIGPDSASISICNYNLGSGWTTVANLDGDLHYDSVAAGLDNTSVAKQNDTEIVLEPVELMGETGQGKHNYNVTPGLLQVLRDAKHYYAITLERNGSSYELGKNNNKKYAYRNINEKELVKCALLQMAYGFYLDGGGSTDYSNINEQFEYGPNKTITDGNGSATFGARERVPFLDIEEWGKFTAKISMTNFAYGQLNPGGMSTSVVSLTMSNVVVRIKGDADSYIDKFYDSVFEFTVKTLGTKMLPSYSPNSAPTDTISLTMTCTGNNNLLIKIGSNTIVNATNISDRLVYFPMQIHSDSHYWLKDSGYGWWPAGN